MNKEELTELKSQSLLKQVIILTLDLPNPLDLCIEWKSQSLLKQVIILTKRKGQRMKKTLINLRSQSLLKQVIILT